MKFLGIIFKQKSQEFMVQDFFLIIRKNDLNLFSILFCLKYILGMKRIVSKFPSKIFVSFVSFK